MPDAAGFEYNDLIVLIVASAFAGMVTADNSLKLHLVNLTPPLSKWEYSIGLKPIDSPRTNPVLTENQASCNLATKPAGIPSSGEASFTATSIPLFVTFADTTSPIGASWLCCQRNGIGNLNEAPSGSTISPILSVLGVLAIPIISRFDSSTDLIFIVE